MKFNDAVELYVRDMWSQGRFSSPGTEVAYRKTLNAHGEDVDYQDPTRTNRDNCNTTLRRWPNPNTAANRRAILVSFYDWMVEEGFRKANPARQTRRPKRRQAVVPRLMQDETVRVLQAARGIRERRAIFLGICAGLRNAELRGLKGRHFKRAGVIHVSADIAKGGRQRWVPVLADLAPVVDEIVANVADDEYVIPGQIPDAPGPKLKMLDRPKVKSSAQALRRLVAKVGERAGVELHPHMMRHAYADYITRQTGEIKLAQALLGHADIKTTDAYTSPPTREELIEAVKGLTFGLGGHAEKQAAKPLIARRGFEPLVSAPAGGMRHLAGTLAIGRPVIA